MNIDDFLLKYEDEVIRIRRRLHQCAELSTLEYETGQMIRELLEDWDISYEYPIADTGLTALIPGKKEGAGKVVALRADMDALPVYEDRNHPFCSKNPGVMHACGHDAHMAIALSVARYFKLIETQFSGCIKLLFQPAEETIGGALRMMEEGCLENPKVDYCIGLHMAPYLETGDIEVKYGKLYAASDEVVITLKGKGCHGAYPDTGIDAIVLAAQLISSLQTLVSRSVSPMDQCVLSFGTIQGGNAHNIIADTVILTGALRTTDKDTRIHIKELIEQQVQGLCAAFGGSGTVHFKPGYDALINTDELVDVLVRESEPILGKTHIHWKETPGMGVEDFSFFLEKTPGVFYHLGCGNKEKGLTAPLHSRDFSLDEASLALGIRLQIMLAEALLKL